MGGRGGYSPFYLCQFYNSCLQETLKTWNLFHFLKIFLHSDAFFNDSILIFFPLFLFNDFFDYFFSKCWLFFLMTVVFRFWLPVTLLARRTERDWGDWLWESDLHTICKRRAKVSSALCWPPPYSNPPHHTEHLFITAMSLTSSPSAAELQASLFLPASVYLQKQTKTHFIVSHVDPSKLGQKSCIFYFFTVFYCY